jgi:hypothetical protein
MRALSLVPIAMYLAAAAYFLLGFLEVSNFLSEPLFTALLLSALIGILVWIALAISMTWILRRESAEGRPFGVFGIPPVALLAFNLFNLGLIVFSIYGLWRVSNCGMLTLPFGTAWSVSFTLGNLLLFITCVDSKALKGRLGELASHLSFLNGLMVNLAPIIIAFTLSGVLCAGPAR